jgi:predicted metal-dependent hydrolase
VSLVEVVISIVLMGTVVAAILNAVTTSIRMSSVSRDAAQVETVVVNAADRINRAPIRCDIDGYTEYAVAAVRSQGWWTNEGEFAQAANVRHEFYDPTASPPWREGVCPADDFGKRLIQRVSVTVTSPNESVSRTIQVVKSDV